jgi:hypothetical protein
MVEFVCGNRTAGLKAHHDLFGVTLDNDRSGYTATVGRAVISQRLL